MTPRKVVKRKRRLNRKLRLPLALIVIVIALFVGYDQYGNHQLRTIGYANSSISAIKKQGLKQALIKRGEYSPALEAAVNNSTYDSKYHELYFAKDSIGDTDKLLFDKLQSKKQYNEEQALLLLKSLELGEISPLLVFDKVEDINIYIDDVTKNREKNQGQFVLDNNYLNAYENTAQTDISKGTLMLTNVKTQLDETYTPDNLKLIPNECRLREMFLQAEAADAFTSMCQEIQQHGLKIASTSAYRSRLDQQAIYDARVEIYGQTEAEKLVSRPGFSEHETGLAVDIASMTKPNVVFSQSSEAAWLAENSYKYGFIVHFVEGYSSITGVSYESWHFRYVGTDTAQKIMDTQNVFGRVLTFDEYYHLYID